MECFRAGETAPLMLPCCLSDADLMGRTLIKPLKILGPVALTAKNPITSLSFLFWRSLELKVSCLGRPLNATGRASPLMQEPADRLEGSGDDADQAGEERERADEAAARSG